MTKYKPLINNFSWKVVYQETKFTKTTYNVNLKNIQASVVFSIGLILILVLFFVIKVTSLTIRNLIYTVITEHCLEHMAGKNVCEYCTIGRT